ncbi:SDR family oxidoreductase [Cytobacillus sp. IB215665]|uniref:SDR family NAD(P)-dependent oxidoreductase n=1 Tax=Cytobacillus sp. IB215665 TaxID=3097357 RepID=UPI002A109899|nr:SDR family oxidoreductase [Cytobacillus sp. IB215665]MDX8364341.1 SDR family oxidoreductase [Cytobacillus sp. IB215665]
MNTLLNKNIVITGASSGIGEKIALKVAEMGARPIMLARSEDKLREISSYINEKASVDSLYFPLDVSNLAQVKVVFQQIYQQVGHIDILVNNAGFGIFDSFIEANMDDIERMFAVNVLGLTACTKEVLPSMVSNNSGHIINIASQAGKLATPKSSGYSASKHAVIGFTNSLRMELAKTNIHVSAVNPGPIETNFFNTADKSGNYVKNVKKIILKSEYVSEQIIKLMIHPKRELNLPRWMNASSVLYHLFPRAFEKFAGVFDKK